MKYASVCDGIGAVHVAWKPLGWECAWVSEIEPFPIAVVEHNFPGIPNLGDITKITEDQLHERGAIDLLVGGTPCQGFSVAGLRGGLDDPRSQLALGFCQLVAATRPAWVLWENVPGVRSSWTGPKPPSDLELGREREAKETSDFGCFLEALGQLGYGWAYRSLDAQYFGLAQRRKRVFVIGHLGDWRRAAAVLFERESLRGNPAPSREAGQNYSYETSPSIRAHGPGHSRIGDTCGQDPVIATALRHVARERVCHMAKGGDPTTDNYVTHALRAEGFDASEDGTGRGTPIIPIDFQNCNLCGEVFGTLDAAQAKGNRGHGVIAFTQNQCGDVLTGDIAPSMNGNQNATERNAKNVAGALGVRRLTPRECERLQGYQDNYTAIQFRGKLAADGPRYRALGNSMAVPCMRWLGKRIELVDKLTLTGYSI